jgi:MioC protein
MATSFTILVGTMTGTAELVAEEVRDALEPEGHAIAIKPMDGLDATVLEPGRTYLVCTSTYGQGDVPDNAMQLFEDLEARRPDLSGLRYGVISLGDRTYGDTFCHGGKRFDELLAALNAERIGERLDHDASSGSVPEEAGLDWARGWVRLLEERLAAAA